MDAFLNFLINIFCSSWQSSQQTSYTVLIKTHMQQDLQLFLLCIQDVLGWTVFAETVYNFYNLPNVENIAVGSSQVNFVQQGSGNILQNL